MDTLDKYFTYNPDLEKARDIFIKLDYKMKELHADGKYIDISAANRCSKRSNS